MTQANVLKDENALPPFVEFLCLGCHLKVQHGSAQGRQFESQRRNTEVRCDEGEDQKAMT